MPAPRTTAHRAGLVVVLREGVVGDGADEVRDVAEEVVEEDERELRLEACTPHGDRPALLCTVARHCRAPARAPRWLSMSSCELRQGRGSLVHSGLNGVDPLAPRRDNRRREASVRLWVW